MVIGMDIGVYFLFIVKFWKAMLTCSVTSLLLPWWHTGSPLVIAAGRLQRNPANQAQCHGPKACSGGFAAAGWVSFLPQKRVALKFFRRISWLGGAYPFVAALGSPSWGPGASAKTLFTRTPQRWPASLLPRIMFTREMGLKYSFVMIPFSVCVCVCCPCKKKHEQSHSCMKWDDFPS